MKTYLLDVLNISFRYVLTEFVEFQKQRESYLRSRDIKLIDPRTKIDFQNETGLVKVT